MVGVVRHARIGHKLVLWDSSLVIANMYSWCASFFITKKKMLRAMSWEQWFRVCAMWTDRCI